MLSTIISSRISPFNSRARLGITAILERRSGHDMRKSIPSEVHASGNKGSQGIIERL